MGESIWEIPEHTDWRVSGTNGCHAADSLATRSLEQVTATLEDPAQVVTTRLKPTAEIPEGSIPPPIIPVVVPPRETGTILESILNHPDKSPSWRTTPVRSPTRPPVIHAPVPRKVPGFPLTTQIWHPKRRRAQ